MSIKVDIVDHRGNIRSFKSAESIEANTRFGVEFALWRSGKDIQAEFDKQVLSKTQSGIVYRLKGGRRHIAASDGETPSNISGTYRRGFGFNVNGAHELAIGNTVEYAEYLELGTNNKDGSVKMNPKPGLSNSIVASERDIIRNLTTGIRDKNS